MRFRDLLCLILIIPIMLSVGCVYDDDDDGDNNNNDEGILDTSFSGDGIVQLDTSARNISLNIAKAKAQGTTGSVTVVDKNKIKKVIIDRSKAKRRSIDFTQEENQASKRPLRKQVKQKSSTSRATSDNFGTSVAITSDDKIVVAGTVEQSDGNIVIVVAQFEEDGDLDTANFNNPDGFIVLTTTLDNTNRAPKLAINPSDGKIAVVTDTLNGDNDIRVFQLLSDGTLDTGFDADGEVDLDGLGGTADNNDFGNGVVYDENSRVVVCGSSIEADGDSTAVVVALATDGSVDNTFTGGNDGEDFIATDVIVDGDDDIFIVGNADDGSGAVEAFFAKMDNTLTLITNFGGDGFVLLENGNEDVLAEGIALDSRDDLLMAAQTQDDDNFDVAVVARVNGDDGDFDDDFDDNGIQVIFADDDLLARDITNDGNGNFLVCGQLDQDNVVFRVEDDGDVDRGFGDDGAFVGENLLGESGTFDDLQAVVIDDVNRVVSAGTSFNGSNFDIVIIRLLN